MKRSLADWLLLPLFLLPLLAGAGFSLDARHRYLEEIAEFSTNGEQVATKWLEAEPPGDLRLDRILAAVRDQPADQQVPFRLSGVEGVVWLGQHSLGAGKWAFSNEYPVGLSAESLKDSKVRIEVETGRAPIDAAMQIIAPKKIKS